MQSAEFTAEI